MTVISMSDAHADAHGVNVWRCEGCGCVHLRAEGVLLTFTPAEFADFTRTVADCYAAQEMYRLTGDPT